VTQRLGEDVRRELARFGSSGVVADVVAAWPAAVGETIAANAWPARLGRDGTIHVAVSSSAWGFELAQLEGEIAARLAHVLREDRPRRLRFAPGHVPEPTADAVSKLRRNPPEPSASERAEAARIAARIGDEELRELVARAVAASLAQASADRSF